MMMMMYDDHENYEKDVKDDDDNVIMNTNDPVYAQVSFLIKQDYTYSLLLLS